MTKVATMAGDLSLRDSLEHEVGILKLVMAGQEGRVSDEQRRSEFEKSDLNQSLHGNSAKNLDFYIHNGIEIDFSPEAKDQAMRYCAIDDRDVPLIEKLKAQRLLDINGFAESRVMYAVHDMIDHVWLFREMREAGILEKYSDFLHKIDMGESAFLYSRQAELFASVGFGSRRWSIARQQGEQLVLNRSMINGILLSSEDDRAHRAASLLGGMKPDQQNQAVFMIENMAVQFADERRRWGAVKISEGTDNELSRPLDLFDPLHISIMLESLDLLQNSKKFKAAQLSATVSIEAVLEESLSSGNSDDKIKIPLNLDASMPKIKGDKIDWIRHNLSVTTSYNRID